MLNSDITRVNERFQSLRSKVNNCVSKRNRSTETNTAKIPPTDHAESVSVEKKSVDATNDCEVERYYWAFVCSTTRRSCSLTRFIELLSESINYRQSSLLFHLKKNVLESTPNPIEEGSTIRNQQLLTESVLIPYLVHLFSLVTRIVGVPVCTRIHMEGSRLFIRDTLFPRSGFDDREFPLSLGKDVVPLNVNKSFLARRRKNLNNLSAHGMLLFRNALLQFPVPKKQKRLISHDPVKLVNHIINEYITREQQDDH
ncbi:hypothetical protein ACOME3_010217 [Neoechinorhynchus agilis]